LNTNSNSAAQRRGKPASLENATRNSQDNNPDAHFTKGRLGPSVSFGKYAEKSKINNYL